MQINATFESLEELKSFAGMVMLGEDLASMCRGEGVTRPATKRQVTKKLPEVKAEEVKSAAAQAEPVIQETLEDESGGKEKTEPSQAVENDPPEKTYSLEEVRGKLAELNRSGKRAQVQEIISSFGVKKLSEISEDKYAEVMKKAGEL